MLQWRQRPKLKSRSSSPRRNKKHSDVLTLLVAWRRSVVSVLACSQVWPHLRSWAHRCLLGRLLCRRPKSLRSKARLPMQVKAVTARQLLCPLVEAHHEEAWLCLESLLSLA